RFTDFRPSFSASQRPTEMGPMAISADLALLFPGRTSSPSSREAVQRPLDGDTEHSHVRRGANRLREAASGSDLLVWFCPRKPGVLRLAFRNSRLTAVGPGDADRELRFRDVAVRKLSFRWTAGPKSPAIRIPLVHRAPERVLSLAS